MSAQEDAVVLYQTLLLDPVQEVLCNVFALHCYCKSPSRQAAKSKSAPTAVAAT